jgi:hypothetical protein
MDTISCAACRIELAEPLGLDAERRPPCPQCGSTSRALAMTIHDSVKVRDRLGMSARSPGEKRPFIEQVVGEELRRSVGDWVKKERVIDRRNDRYLETVTEQDSTVIHHTDELLSEHFGHGSARAPSKDEQG